MILIIRGHIRNSFESRELRDFVAMLYLLFPNLKIYIHTWNIFSNNLSWRPIQENNTIVDINTICNYFGELTSCIKHIIIDDDKNIQLNGNLSGGTGNSPLPIVGWKNYWYGKYRIINYLYNNSECNKNEPTVNIRFDLFSNSNNFNSIYIIEFIKYHYNYDFNKNIFLFTQERPGIDNIYMGNITTMHRLTHVFHTDLDSHLHKIKDTIHQEYLVYRINEEIFNQV